MAQGRGRRRPHGADVESRFVPMPLRALSFIHSLIQPVSVHCPPLYMSHSAKHTPFTRDAQPQGTHNPEKRF